MDVILLERVGKLGNLGDVVQVKDGYARNYLLPSGKALRANKANREKFEAERAVIEAANAEKAKSAGTDASKLDGEHFILIRQAGEAGQLYGSVSPRDIAEAATASGIAVNRNQVELDAPIKVIGLHEVRVALHAEVDATITINVARSQDEAEAQARGENLTEEDDGEYDALAAAEALLNAQEDEDAEAEEVAEEEAEAADEESFDDEDK
ncbi:MAG TPA: 50S ribosomal protein L9 [Rhizobiales bacterium]|nr:50S ribosomal protein L9 [Hyphomicrobiales bacterium]